MRMESKKRALDKIYKRRDRYEIPEWQRDEVWTDDKKRLLIDTILNGWKLPKFYFSKLADRPEEHEVVDGQQRLMAIFEFIEGGLALSPESSKKFGGPTYQKLPDELVDAFDDYEIEYDEITDATEEQLKEFFRRLQGGLTLTASEKLNAVHSNLTDFARRLSKHDFFNKKVSLRNTRMAHFDIVSKVAAIEVDGLDTGLRFDELNGTFTANAQFSSSSATAKRLRGTLQFLDSVFPKRNPILRNRSTIQSFATLASVIVATGRHRGHEPKVLEFFEDFGKELSRQVELGQDATDPEYIEFQRTLSANIKAGAKTRHEILLRKLLLHQPEFIEVLGTEAIAQSGINADVKRLGDAVASLVESINEQYSAQTGKDLFKATNKTTAALRRLGTPVLDFQGYRAMVEDLYFLFWEGTGQRLSGVEPLSFKDIRDLRTALQHDVDHGNKRAAAAKRRKLAATGAKYGIHGSPAGLGPERLTVAQARILESLRRDVQSLSSKIIHA